MTAESVKPSALFLNTPVGPTLNSQTGFKSVTNQTARTKKQVYDRLYQACKATNQGNAECQNMTFKQGNASLSNCYHDSSMFTASLRRVRMKANLQRLKEKELRVVQERRDLRYKQRAIK